MIERAGRPPGHVWRIAYNGAPLAVAATLPGAKAYCRADAVDRRAGGPPSSAG